MDLHGSRRAIPTGLAEAGVDARQVKALAEHAARERLRVTSGMAEDPARP